MKHRLSAMALALSMGLSLASPIAADDFEQVTRDGASLFTNEDAVTDSSQNVGGSAEGEEKTNDGNSSPTQPSGSKSDTEDPVERFFPKNTFTDPIFRQYLYDTFGEIVNTSENGLGAINEIKLEAPKNFSEATATNFNLNKIKSLEDATDKSEFMAV